MSNNAPIDLLTASSAAAPADPEANPRPQLNTFIPFPKLPLELRRKIFRETFDKPSHVHLHYPPFLSPEQTEVSSPWERPGSLPVALYICHESRVEALMHHQIVLPDEYNPMYRRQISNGMPFLWKGNDKLSYVPKPFWFSSSRDSAYITLDGWFYDTRCNWYTNNLNNLSSKDCKVASTVRNLEIRLTPDPHGQGAWILIFFGQRAGSLGKMLLLFKELRTLCFTCPHPTISATSDVPVGLVAGIEAWLEQNKWNFANGKAPKVFLANVVTDENGEAVMPTISQSA
ncbi:hypothetical protein IFR05_006134 [Cadophora sp. M221]|nr:hypothetical protein IFR05_006134 [Cadophora sp. M221]